MQKSFKVKLTILFIFSLILILLSLGFGYYKVSIGEVFRFIFNDQSNQTLHNVLINIRLPRVIAAFVIGISLCVSGATYQGVFKNPLVSPDILGVSSGCAVGAALGILYNLPYYYVQLLAFIFGLLAVGITYLLSTTLKSQSKVNMLLCGIMVSALCESFLSLIKLMADTTDQLPDITFWLMGSISNVSNQSLLLSLPFMVIGFLMLLLMSNQLNLLTLSFDEAKSLGVNTTLSMSIVIIASTLMCSGAVCLGGKIPWVGLMIPHIARGIFTSNYKKLIIGCALLGGVFMLLVDDIIRAFFVIEIPLGLLISFIGAPFFYFLIKKGRIS